MGLRDKLRAGGWNGPAVAGTVLAVAGVIVALGAWLWPRSPAADPGPGPAAQQTTGVPAPATSAAPAPATSAPAPAGSRESRALADLTVVRGGGSLRPVAGSRPTVAIDCAAGGSGDPFREIEWSLPSEYSGVSGTVSVGGPIDRESRVQLEWFSGDVRVYNNSMLRLGPEKSFEAALTGDRQLRLRITCQDVRGVATIAGVAVFR